MTKANGAHEPHIRSGLTKRKNSRSLLIASARNIFGEQGYLAAEMDQIGKSSGRSSPTLYNHFRSKGELGLAVIEAQFGSTPEGQDLSTLTGNMAELSASLAVYGGIGLALAEQKAVSGQSSRELLPKVFDSFIGAVVLEQSECTLRADLPASVITETSIDLVAMHSLAPAQDNSFSLLLEGLSCRG